MPRARRWERPRSQSSPSSCEKFEVNRHSRSRGRSCQNIDFITEFDPPQGLATDSTASASWSHSPLPVRKRYSCRPEGSSTSTSQKPDSDSESGIGCLSHWVNDPTKATDFAFGRVILKRTFFESCFGSRLPVGLSQSSRGWILFSLPALIWKSGEIWLGIL